MREIISLHVGQFGIQLGQEVWSRMADECSDSLDNSKIFLEQENGVTYARAVFCDLD